MSSSRFTLQLADLDVQVLAFEAEEAIGRPYRIELELVSGQPDLDLPALLRQPAWLALDEARGMTGWSGASSRPSAATRSATIASNCARPWPGWSNAATAASSSN